MLVDTHAHLNIKAFELDREEVIKRCLENNIWIINIGTNYETSKKAVEIAGKYPEGIFAAIGLHPINIKQNQKSKIKNQNDKSKFKNIENILEEEFSYEGYKELTKSKKVVAVGEIGLDYYWRPKTTKKKEFFKQKQKDLLLKQLELAKELNLPVIFHCRMAHEDLLEILNYKLKTINYQLRGVMHGFVGTLEQLKEYLNFGFYIGFNGIIFKKIEGIKVAETSSHLSPRATSSRSVFEENIRNTPLERILIETDCPYLIPSPVEGRNEPLYVKYVAERIAEIKKISFEKVAEVSTENAKRLFKLG